ncbi:hypothetical protein SAMN05444166_6409 [Singulisphaera sp. GP187]|uniref:hypothetical protein n=1 Tax=Singulisphaera sp. GP187 TaxID=1882752 RepID=UPI00092C0453|nr:hypothetical protein [Singulisphaera sp. GP187]SIO60484.1 hypothetical protein SAMN05444166_6409 [Singulisphaera sp. GP187]
MDPTDRDPLVDRNAFEQRLGQWRPAAGGLDRDRMLFEAGRASAGDASLRRFAVGSIAGLLVVALGLGGLLVHERSQRRFVEAELAAVRHPVNVDRPTSPAPTVVVAADPNSYLVLTRRMIDSAPDEFPFTASLPAPAQPSLPDEPPLTPLRARQLGRVIEL